MPTVDLIFDGALLRSTDLIFGGEPAAPPASEPGVQVSGSVSTGWQRAETVADAVRTTYAEAEPRTAAVVARWRDHAHRSSGARSVWADAVGVHTSVSSWWTEHLRCQAAVRSGWGELQHLRTGVLSRWQRGQGVQRVALVRWQRAMPAGAGWSNTWRSGAVVHAGTVIVWQRARGADVSVRSWWQRAMRPLPGYWQPPIDPGELPLTPHDLIFCGPWTGSTDLVFGDDACSASGIVIPKRRSYVVINDVLLLRVADNYPLIAESLSIEIDADSWVPQFSATLPGPLLDAVMPSPDPVLLETSINGTTWRWLAERVANSRRFGNRSVTVSGRGFACELAAPYAPVASYDNASGPATAQQLIAAAMPVGWTLDWQIDDWLVPIGVFAMSGTPVDVALRVAEAVGAYVQAAPALSTLSVLPRYPIVPWQFGSLSADVTLPVDVTDLDSVERVDRAAYNVVFIGGETQGILGRVKKNGTAGDIPAPSIVDSLITETAAARQRGIAVLGDTGRKGMYTYAVPVIPASGIFRPGQIIDVVDGALTTRGIVRANRITSVFPQVRQTFTMEVQL